MPALGSHSLLEHMRCPQAHCSGRTLEGDMLLVGQSSEVQSRAELMRQVDLAYDPITQSASPQPQATERPECPSKLPGEERRGFAIAMES